MKICCSFSVIYNVLLPEMSKLQILAVQVFPVLLLALHHVLFPLLLSGKRIFTLYTDYHVGTIGAKCALFSLSLALFTLKYNRDDNQKNDKKDYDNNDGIHVAVKSGMVQSLVLIDFSSLLLVILRWILE